MIILVLHILPDFWKKYSKILIIAFQCIECIDMKPKNIKLVKKTEIGLCTPKERDTHLAIEE